MTRASMRSRLLFALSLVLAACGSSNEGAGAPASEGDATEPGVPFSEQVAVDHIALYQGVKVTLVDEQAVIPVKKLNAPIIPGRPALVRVHAKTLQYRTRVRAAAELRIHVAGRPDFVASDAVKSIVPFDDLEMGSTFNFEVPGDALAPGASLEVVLHDEKATDTTVRYPEAAEESVKLNVGKLAPTLRVKFVPVRYEGDGSGRTPDMSAAAVENYEKTLYKLYPTASVEVMVRDELRWPLQVHADGEGWDTLLDALIETRSDDNAADDVYYIAVFDPAETAHDWCTSGDDYGCVLGIAPQANARDVYLRVAMITGYSGNEGTLAQELGHAMGRAHAPCGGAAAVDPDYPYGRANIGVFGWDIVDHELVDPGSRVYDFMSYCHPNWVSDYTFGGLYERMVKVAETKRTEVPMTGGAGSASSGSSASDFVRISHVQPDGSVRPGPKVRASHVDASSFGSRAIAGLRGGLRIDPVR
jgi:hypothetical protein